MMLQNMVLLLTQLVVLVLVLVLVPQFG